MRPGGAVSHRRGALTASLALLALLASASCAPPAAGVPAAPALLYVANSYDGTITRLDGATGRAIGRPLPAGPAPWRLATGPRGTLLVLPAHKPSALTHVAPAGGDGAWVVRPVPLEAHAALVLLAGDGRAHAALAYRVAAPTAPPAAWTCRLMLLDVATGTAAAPPVSPCAPGEIIVGLALGPGPGGPTAYLSLWRSATGDAPGLMPGGGRLRALDLATGAVVAEAPLAGLPGPLLLAPGLGAAGQRLYGVEGFHSAGIPGVDAFAEADLADRWLLRGRDPLTLAPQSAVALPARPRALAVAPDGDHAYALAGNAGPVGPRDPARASTALVHLDLRRGSAVALGSVPGSGYGGLAVAGGRIYAPDPDGDAVAVVDRRSGVPLPPVKAGRGPVGIALAGGFLTASLLNP